MQSDPTGLEGGINTFAYAEGNPVMTADPRGLLALSVNVSWQDHSASAMKAMGIKGGGFTDPHLSQPKCACQESCGVWKLIECSATLDVKVLIEAGMPPGIDRNVREAEQQHVTDLENGADALADRGVMAEQAMRRLSFSSQAECEKQSSDAVSKGLHRGLKRITDWSRAYWDDSGRHNIWRPTYNFK